MIDVFDSDGERDISLPWYRPTRVFRTAQGDDAGWLSRSWKRPKYDVQMPIELADLGRRFTNWRDAVSRQSSPRAFS